MQFLTSTRQKVSTRMTRLEENKMVIENMVSAVEHKPTGTYEEMMTFQLGVIATMLADISKALR